MRERELFIEALQKESAGERAVFLDEACSGDDDLRQRVNRLLEEHQQQESFILDVPPPGIAGTNLPPMAESPGSIIGPYKLLQQIGEGGMGTVYMAEQSEPVQRKVALKIIKLGMDSRQVIARFEAERQALALMDHPNIAKMLEAGATNTGQPYFVMELVKGISITSYCDQHQLSTEQRLDLFLTVCSAVQHAHQKGIIHRDLKPNNVLVADYDDHPVAKIIDFGVAKAVGQPLTERTMFTEFGQVLGTIEYMSPEQAKLNQLDIDTRTDIYSLGVLLYELLAGSTPFDRERLRSAAFDEMLRIIREEEPVNPSTRLSTSLSLPSIAANRRLEPKKLTTLVRGDLDWIVMKSLEKDRSRRYDTATGLAEDIQRYLTDQPVEARQPTRTYRLKKFIRRNKVGVLAGSAIALALTLGTVVSTWQAVRATQASREAEVARESEAKLRQQAEASENRAQTEAIKSRQVARFLEDMLNGVGPWVARGRDTTVLRDIMDGAAGRIGTALKDQPDVEAELRNVMGVVYWSVGENQKAETMHRQALALYRKLVGSEHPLVAESLVKLALTLRDQGKKSEAETALREALAIQRKVLGSEHPEVANTLRDLGVVLWAAHKLEEAESVEREALALRRKLYGSQHHEVADSLNRLADVLTAEGQHTEAEALAREAVAILRNTSRNSPDDLLATTLETLAIVLQHEGNLPEAEAAARESLSMMSKATGTGSWTVGPLYRLMVILAHEGKNEELEQVFNVYPIPSVGRAAYRADLLQSRAVLLRDKGKLAEAENSFREAWAIRKQLPGAEKSLTAESLNGLIDVLQRQGKPAEAEKLRGEAAQPAGAIKPQPSTDLKSTDNGSPTTDDQPQTTNH